MLASKAVGEGGVLDGGASEAVAVVVAAASVADLAWSDVAAVELEDGWLDVDG